MDSEGEAVEGGCLGEDSKVACGLPASNCQMEQPLRTSTSMVIDCNPCGGGLGSFDRSEGLSVDGKRSTSCSGWKSRHRQKKIIMGRDFLLVKRNCHRDLSGRFRFFHIPSLLAVEVKIHEPSLTTNQAYVPEDIMANEACSETIENDNHLDGVSDPLSFVQMEVVEEIPSSPSSCVTGSPAHDQNQLRVEAFLSDNASDDFQDSASGPHNLLAKRIVAFRRHWVKDCVNRTVRCFGRQKHRTAGCAKGSDGSDKMQPLLARSKRKRERLIEDDPYAYRAPQRRVIH